MFRRLRQATLIRRRSRFSCCCDAAACAAAPSPAAASRPSPPSFCSPATFAFTARRPLPRRLHMAAVTFHAKLRVIYARVLSARRIRCLCVMRAAECGRGVMRNAARFSGRRARQRREAVRALLRAAAAPCRRAFHVCREAPRRYLPPAAVCLRRRFVAASCKEAMCDRDDIAFCIGMQIAASMRHCPELA